MLRFLGTFQALIFYIKGNIIMLKILSLAICAVIVASCQPLAADTIPTVQSTIAVTKVVSESIEPSPTPVNCTYDDEYVAINVEPLSADSARFQINGLQPGEKVTLLFVAQPTATQGSEKEISPVNRVEANGTFSYLERGLTRLDDAAENIWTVKVIHSDGVSCQEFTLP